MSNLVKIGGVAYRFISMHGRQFINRREFSAVRDDDVLEVRISDSIPADDQLAMAAKATASIIEDQNRSHVLGLERIGEVGESIPHFRSPGNARPL